MEVVVDIAPKKELSLFDSVCIIVGIIIGAGIFEITPTVASCMGGWAGILAIWLAGGLLAIIAVGLFAPVQSLIPAETSDVTMGGLKLALILVLFTFGGWNEMAYVAGEVKQPKRNIVRALVIGTVLVTVLYMLVNGAFLHSLGQGGDGFF
jgi:amino acid transporter